MKSKKRKLFKRIISYFILTIFFVISAVVIILWGLGYRWDYHRGTLSKTGILSIEVNQDNFNLFIDGRRYFSDSHQIIVKNLLPGDYTVKVEKENFHPWIKTLTIEPQKITREESIFLFPQKPRIETLDSKLVDYRIAKEGLSLITLDKTRRLLKQIKLFGQQPTKIIESEAIEDFYPNKDGTKVVIRQGAPFSKLLLFNFENPEETNELPLEIDKIGKLEWSQDDNKNLFLISEGNLYRIDTSNRPLTLDLILPSVNDFTIAAKRIFYWTKENNRFVLKQSNLEGESEEKILDVAQDTPSQIIPSPDNAKVLLNRNNNLYLLENKNLKKIAEGVKGVKWSSQSREFLYHTDCEINLGKFIDNQFSQKLVNRFSQKIDYLDWFPYPGYLILGSENKIKVIEEDGQNLLELSSYSRKPEISIKRNFIESQIIVLFLKGAKDGFILQKMILDNPYRKMSFYRPGKIPFSKDLLF